MGTQEEESSIQAECVWMWSDAVLIEHVVVLLLLLLVVRLIEVLHFLLGPARSVTAQSFHRAQAVAVVILVIGWRFLRFLHQKTAKHFIIVATCVVSALNLQNTGCCLRFIRLRVEPTFLQW